MALNPRRTALMVCDMQERFRSAIFGFDNIAKSIARMIRVAEMLEMKVIVTEQNPRALGLNLGTHPKTLFSMFTPEVCKALGGRYADGQAANGSADPNGVDNVIIVGIESHVCVLQTALEAVRKCKGDGTRPIVLADAVSSINPQEIPVSLDRMRHAGVDVGTTESVIFQLMGDAKHPRFKDVSALIKEEKEATADTLKKVIGAVPI